MRYLGLILLSSVLTVSCSSGGGTAATQPNQGWSWVGGTNQINSNGIYANLGQFSESNMPGARTIAISWIDNNGNLWLFGGQGYASGPESGSLNDLWEYNPSTKQWAWRSGANTINSAGVYGTQGQASVNNTPGARFGGVSWRDQNGNLWLFGGFGYDQNGNSGSLNDLWEYNPDNGSWTWVSGSTQNGAIGSYGIQGIAAPGNTPGARLGSVAWTDNAGNLWLFGGARDVLTLEDYNDLWRFNPSTRLWTWVGGVQTTNSPGVYGIRGVPNQSNQPGARVDAVGWVESSGQIWLYGGSGVDGIGTRGLLNDLWRYDPLTDTWTWMSGSNFSDMYGDYGTLGVSTPNTIPGGREHRVPLSSFAPQSQLWMFGGDGYSANDKGYLNDLWQFNPANNQWVWIAGANESNAYSVYGQAGLISSQNTPGARIDSVGWVDSQGNLWLFGGNGNSANNSGLLNDLWKFTANNN